MIRVFVLSLVFALGLAGASEAQTSRLSDKTIGQLEDIADRIAAIDPGNVPEILLRATIAAEEPDHLIATTATSKLTLQLARMHLGPMPTLQRNEAESVLSGFLAERMSAPRIAKVYAATVYYGRNCYGFEAASLGLARQPATSAGENVFLALAALPRSPSWYLTDRVALKERVGFIVDEMKKAGMLGAADAKRLEDLPIANLDSGKGC